MLVQSRKPGFPWRKAWVIIPTKRKEPLAPPSTKDTFVFFSRPHSTRTPLKLEINHGLRKSWRKGRARRGRRRATNAPGKCLKSSPPEGVNIAFVVPSFPLPPELSRTTTRGRWPGPFKADRGFSGLEVPFFASLGLAKGCAMSSFTALRGRASPSCLSTPSLLPRRYYPRTKQVSRRGARRSRRGFACFFATTIIITTMMRGEPLATWRDRASEQREGAVGC